MRHQAILAGNHVVAGEGLQDHQQERVGFTEFLPEQGDRRIADLKNSGVIREKRSWQFPLDSDSGRPAMG